MKKKQSYQRSQLPSGNFMAIRLAIVLLFCGLLNFSFGQADQVHYAKKDHIMNPYTSSPVVLHYPERGVFNDGIYYYYYEATIPQNSSGRYLYLQAEGADGGAYLRNKNSTEGGEGSTASAFFQIGNGLNQIPPGATIRFIIGEKGGQKPKAYVGSVGMGGGGGTGLVFKSPLLAPDKAWVTLLAAGGGGGAFGDCCTAKSPGSPASNTMDGTASHSNALSAASPGGTDGTCAFDEENDVLHGGGGIRTDANTEPDNMAFHNGDPTGGKYLGDISDVNGGYGYGGGGYGGQNGGGGGGYSGGGTNKLVGGGGGGSYIDDFRAVKNTAAIIRKATTDQQGNGFISYQFFDALPFESLPGTAMDVTTNANDRKWVIGNTKLSGGYSIYRWSGSNWTQVPGAGTHIAVAPNGIPWHINENGNIYKANDVNAASWTQVPGSARDIAIDNTGRVWVIGNTKVSGGYSIHYWNGSSWTKVNGGATRIGAGDVPWLVNENGNIYQAADGKASSWKQISGRASDIGVDQNGQAYIVGGSGIIYRRENNSWKTLKMVASAVSAGRNALIGSNSGIALAESPYRSIAVATLTKGGDNESIAKPGSTSVCLLQSGNYCLSWQMDGNLVLNGPLGPVWASGTNGQGTGLAFQQADGNLVIYKSGAAIWASGTSDSGYSDHKGGTELRLTPAGALTIVNSDGRVLWKVN